MIKYTNLKGEKSPTTWTQTAIIVLSVPSSLFKYVYSLHRYKDVFRVCIVAWHPITRHVPFSRSCDNLVIIWYVRIGESFINLNGENSDMINNVNWNQHGSQILTVLKYKKWREIDSKKQEAVDGKERVQERA